MATLPRPGVPRRLKAMRDQRDQRSDAAFADRFAANMHQHWAQVRTQSRREPQPPPAIGAGASDMRPARVPYGVDLAAAWGWRFLIIVAAAYVIVRAVGFLMVVVLPVAIALLLAALVIPLVALLGRMVSRGLAALIVVIGVLAVVVLMLAFATQQVIDGSTDLARQTVDGLERIREWLQEGPLNASESQINDGIAQLQSLVTSSNAEVVSRVQEVSAAVGHIVAGFFIVLFASYFFLADGERIWSWVVRLFPRGARDAADSSGRVAWLSLTAFVRATVLVAMVDAVGIMIVAAILNLPFVMAIGVLVFLGSFVPLVGATVSGIVAVLVALVDQGPIVALLMLGGVILVQQLEAHVLQPFLMGRMVSLHPLGVILAIAVGVLAAGIPGALVAVPMAACVNAVGLHLAARSRGDAEITGDTETELAAEPDPDSSPLT